MSFSRSMPPLGTRTSNSAKLKVIADRKPDSPGGNHLVPRPMYSSYWRYSVYKCLWLNVHTASRKTILYPHRVLPPRQSFNHVYRDCFNALSCQLLLGGTVCNTTCVPPGHRPTPVPPLRRVGPLVWCDVMWHPMLTDKSSWEPSDSGIAWLVRLEN